MTSKWRQHQRVQCVAVIRDGLERLGLWPFRVYNFQKAAYEKRIAEARNAGPGALLKAYYSEPLKFLYFGEHAVWAYQHRRIGR